LNIDLELVSTSDPQGLVADLGKDVLIHRADFNAGHFVVWLQLASGPDPSDLDGVISEFERLFRRLAPDSRRCWEECEDRALNMGIQAGLTPGAMAFHVSAASIASMKTLQVRLVTTVYAVPGPAAHP
jgi:hypothetical protein